MKIYKLCPFSQINNICLWAIEGEGEPEVLIIHSLIKNRTPSQGKKSSQNVKKTLNTSIQEVFTQHLAGFIV